MNAANVYSDTTAAWGRLSPAERGKILLVASAVMAILSVAYFYSSINATKRLNNEIVQSQSGLLFIEKNKQNLIGLVAKITNTKNKTIEELVESSLRERGIESFMVDQRQDQSLFVTIESGDINDTLLALESLRADSMIGAERANFNPLPGKDLARITFLLRRFR